MDHSKKLNQNEEIISVTNKIYHKLNKIDYTYFEGFTKFLLLRYGTKININRFDIGNSIELSLTDLFLNNGLDTIGHHNSPRIDISIENHNFSIKYSSCGNIKLHNSNNNINSDFNFTDLLLLTPEKIWIITNESLQEYGINLKEKYLINTGDGLSVKRSLLTKLKKKNYKYLINVNIKINKKLRENKYCFKTFYEKAKNEYEESI